MVRKHQIVTAITLGALAVSLAACQKSGTPASAPPSSFEARVSAQATSTQAQAGKQAVENALSGCKPASVTVTAWEGQLIASKTARQALYGCLGVTTPQGQAALKKCVVKVAGTELSAQGSRASREAAFETQAQKQCVR